MFLLGENKYCTNKKTGGSSSPPPRELAKHYFDKALAWQAYTVLVRLQKYNQGRGFVAPLSLSHELEYG